MSLYSTSESIPDLLEVYFRKAVLDEVEKLLMTGKENPILKRYILRYNDLQKQLRLGINYTNDMDAIHQEYCAVVAILEQND